MDRRWGVLLAGLVVACNPAPPGETYFEQNILPILQRDCATNTSGCHQANVGSNADPYQFVVGNLDVSSFANIQLRRDALAPFGAYPYPLLLIKAVAPATPDPTNPNKLQMPYGSGSQTIDIDVLHSGGSVIQVDSADYLTLETWLQNGATEDGLPPLTPAQTGDGTCSPTVPDTFTATDVMTYSTGANLAGYNTFVQKIQPILNNHGCVSNNCHGAPQSDFYITCGSNPTELAFNFSQAWSFVADPPPATQLLQVPLAVDAGGRGHQGGDQWSSTSDPDYVTILDWAQQVGVLPFCSGCDDTNPRQFFADYVQPLLLSRGCSFEACHSPMATNDFKLRSGTQGFFSAIVLEKNYELLTDNFLALEFPDARRGRAVAKTILGEDYRLTDPDAVGGIAHRGGPVLETPDSGEPSDPADCPTPWAPGASAFCTLQQFVTLERASLLTAGQVTPMDSGDTLSLVYVDRPAAQTADHLEFATFQPGADLMAVQVTLDVEQHATVTGTPQSLTTNCPGFTAGQMDIGMPDVANDGDSVAFAARASTSTPWNIFKVSISSGACSQLVPSVANAANGMLVHNFDPAWSPDGSSLVFASTRGKPGVGPTLSRKRFLPQSDLWSMNLADGTLQQMTALSNSELRPHFMREGRVTMTTEKTSVTTTGPLGGVNGGSFYQLSGRRINWDLTDYHPLLSQRHVSLYANDTTSPMAVNPSINYDAAMDVREGNNGNFMMILYDVDPTTGAPVALDGGGGALATFNRSIGPFEYGRDDLGYLPSVSFYGDPNATGQAGATAAYRAPFYMPDGQIMVSYASPATAAAWQLVEVNPRTNIQTVLLAPPAGHAYVDAVLAYAYPARTLYLNRRQLVFGGSVNTADTSHGVLYMPSAPMVFTLLTANLRRGRPLQSYQSAQYLAVYSEGLCPSTSCAANDMGIYQQRTMLGKAALASDGSVKVQLPAQSGVVLELQDGSGNALVTMGEEHQLGPGEQISMGVQPTLFDAVCGGCHGSISSSELDIAVSADALTGASSSASQAVDPTSIGN